MDRESFEQLAETGEFGAFETGGGFAQFDPFLPPNWNYPVYSKPTATAQNRGGPLNYGREPDISGLPGVHIECKRAETLRLTEWLAQARRDAGRFGGLPAVFHRRNREDWRVTMELPDWLELYRSYQPPGESNHGG